MKYHKYTTILYFGLILALVDCQGPKGDKGDPAPNGATNFSGYILHVKSGPRPPMKARMEHHGDLYTNIAGTEVFIDGTEFRATTDSNNSYKFKNIPYGTYTLTYQRPGFGTIKRYNLSLGPGDSTLNSSNFGYGSLNEICKINIDSTLEEACGIGFDSSINTLYFSLALYSNYYVRKRQFFSYEFSWSLYDTPLYNDFALFISKSSDVSNTKFDHFTTNYKYFFQALPTSNPLLTDTVFVISQSFKLPPNYIKKGETLYGKLYGCNYYASYYGDYIDPSTNKPVFSSVCVKPSKTYSFKIE